MINIYFAAGRSAWAEFRAALEAAFADAGLKVAMTDIPSDPAAVDYIIYAPSSAVQDFTPFTQCKAVLSLWAGVERIVGNRTLTQPLCRMVDRSLHFGLIALASSTIRAYSPPHSCKFWGELCLCPRRSRAMAWGPSRRS